MGLGYGLGWVGLGWVGLVGLGCDFWTYPNTDWLPMDLTWWLD